MLTGFLSKLTQPVSAPDHVMRERPVRKTFMQILRSRHPSLTTQELLALIRLAVQPDDADAIDVADDLAMHLAQVWCSPSIEHKLCTAPAASINAVRMFCRIRHQKTQQMTRHSTDTRQRNDAVLSEH